MHPETQPGEVFLTNINDKSSKMDDFIGRESSYGIALSDYMSIGWHSKRPGKIAYNREGQPIMDWYPVFVHKEEIGNELAEKLIKDEEQRIYPPKG